MTKHSRKGPSDRGSPSIRKAVTVDHRRSEDAPDHSETNNNDASGGCPEPNNNGTSVGCSDTNTNRTSQGLSVTNSSGKPRGYSVKNSSGTSHRYSVKTPNQGACIGARNTDPRSSLRSRLTRYFLATRPWTFVTSLSPVFLGSCLSYKAEGVFDIPMFLTTTLTILLVHGAGNLTNSYCDLFRGVDDENALDRTLVDGILLPKDAVSFMLKLYTASICGFIILCAISPASAFDLTLLFFIGVSGSFLYSAALGLKYTPIGVVVILLIFGPQIATFAFLSQTGHFSLGPMVASMPLAFHAAAITHCRNIRNNDQDKRSGSMTLANILGKTGSFLFLLFLLFTPYVQFIVQGILVSFYLFYPIFSVVLAVALVGKYHKMALHDLPQGLSKFYAVSSFQYIAVLCAIEPQVLPFFGRWSR